MKNLSKLGKALNKAEQKAIFGGDQIKKNDPNCDIMICCGSDSDCPPDEPFGPDPNNPVYTIGHYCTSGVCQSYTY